jgi:hypothetical protein
MVGSFKVRSRILASHVLAGSVSGSPMTGVLGNKLVTPGIRTCVRLFTLSAYSIGVELSYILLHLSSPRSVHVSISLAVSNTTWIHLLGLQKWYSLCTMALSEGACKHISGRQQHDVHSLTWVEEVVQPV